MTAGHLRNGRVFGDGGHVVKRNEGSHRSAVRQNSGRAPNSDNTNESRSTATARPPPNESDLSSAQR